jgi:lipoprotein-releasing system permease protein
LNFSAYIAKRITFNNKKKKLSESVLKIAVSVVALGMAVMIITVSVVGGFKHEIYKKLIGFQSHITIKNRDINNTFESEPVSANQVFYPSLEKESGISHIQRFATKLGIVKAETEVHGVVLKGAGKDYDWSFLKTHLTEGKIPDVLSESKTKDLLISQKTADILNYKTGDKVFIYFIQNPPKARDFIISGIYDTGMEEYDKAGVFCDIRHIQKINDWDENQVSGFEVFIDNFDDLNNMTQLVEGIVSGIIAEDGSMLQVSNFMKDNSFFVQWLKLSDMNVQVILLLMIFVAVLSMIAAMLTIILERTNMIGILKALGANNYSVIRIFIYNGSILILKGMFYGNLFGLIILMIQKFYKLIPLDSKLYYVDSVPVEFNVLNIVLLNAGVFIISALFLIFPAILAAKINPVKTINFK